MDHPKMRDNKQVDAERAKETIEKVDREKNIEKERAVKHNKEKH